MTAYEKAVAQARRALATAKDAEQRAEDCEFIADRFKTDAAEWRRIAQEKLDVARAFEAVAANHAQEEAHERETQAH